MTPVFFPFLPAHDYTQRPYCPYSEKPKRVVFHFFFFLRSCLTQGDCEGSNALTARFVSIFAVVHCVLFIPKDLADNRSPATQGCTIAIYISNFSVPDNSVGNTKLRRRLATELLCLMIRRGTQSFVRDWRMSSGGGEVSSMKTTEMLVGNSGTATKKAIRVWFYFVTIFILHTILSDKCTGKSTLVRAPYLRPKFVTYCKTTGTSFSLIWEPPPSPRQVGKNSSIRLQSITLLHKKFLQFGWLREVVF